MFVLIPNYSAQNFKEIDYFFLFSESWLLRLSLWNLAWAPYFTWPWWQAMGWPKILTPVGSLFKILHSSKQKLLLGGICIWAITLKLACTPHFTLPWWWDGCRANCLTQSPILLFSSLDKSTWDNFTTELFNSPGQRKVANPLPMEM